MTPEVLSRVHCDAFAPERGWSAKELADLLDQPTVHLFSKHGGFALVRVVAGEAELLTLAVSPSSRRQGLANALMRQLLDSIKAERVFLEVAEDNTAAIQLYKSHGFAASGRRKAYYARRSSAAVDALLMEKALNPV